MKLSADLSETVALIDPYLLPFYVQMGMVCSGAILKGAFNSERLDSYEFPEELELVDLNSLSPEILGEKIAIRFKGSLPKKISAIHISWVLEVLCLPDDVDVISFQLESNNIGSPLSISPIPENHIEKQFFEDSIKVPFESRVGFVRKVLSLNKLKGGLALWNEISIQGRKIGEGYTIEEAPFQALKSKDYYNQLFEANHTRTSTLFKSFEKGEVDSSKVIKNFSTYLKKQYGANSNVLIAFLGDSRNQDDFLGLLKNTKVLKNEYSNFLFLEFVFLLKKFSKLQNQISQDLKNAVTELSLAYKNDLLTKNEFGKLVFLLGYFTGYASLYDFKVDIESFEISCKPRLNDSEGEGLALDNVLYSEHKSILIEEKSTINQFSTQVASYQSKPGYLILRALEQKPDLHSRVSMIWYLLKKLDDRDSFFEGLEKALAHKDVGAGKQASYVPRVKELMDREDWEDTLDKAFNDLVGLKLNMDGVL